MGEVQRKRERPSESFSASTYIQDVGGRQSGLTSVVCNIIIIIIYFKMQFTGQRVELSSVEWSCAELMTCMLSVEELTE